MVNSPLIRPAIFWGGVALGGVPLGSHEHKQHRVATFWYLISSKIPDYRWNPELRLTQYLAEETPGTWDLLIDIQLCMVRYKILEIGPNKNQYMIYIYIYIIVICILDVIIMLSFDNLQKTNTFPFSAKVSHTFFVLPTLFRAETSVSSNASCYRDFAVANCHNWDAEISKRQKNVEIHRHRDFKISVTLQSIMEIYSV